MTTNRKRRTRKIVKHVLTDCVRYYLQTGLFPSRMEFPEWAGRVEAFMLRKNDPVTNKKLEEIWRLHRDEILQQWKLEKRRGKPWAAKIFDHAI